MVAEREVVSILRPAALPDVEVLSVSHSTRQWRVYHDTYTLGAIRATRRVAEWWYRGRLYEAVPRVAAMIEPGEVHLTKRVFAPATGCAIQIAPRLMSEIGRECGVGATPHFRGAQCDDPRFNDAILAFHDAVACDASPLEQETLLVECVHAVLQRYGERRITDRRRDSRGARIARDYLRAHPQRRVSLDDLARISGSSRYHLVHSFTKFYGLPPHAYQNALRIAAAREALRSGVSLSALDVGFADQSHLSRFFKRGTAMTPGRYASACSRPHGAAALVREPAPVQHHAGGAP